MDRDTPPFIRWRCGNKETGRDLISAANNSNRKQFSGFERTFSAFGECFPLAEPANQKNIPVD